MTAESQSAGRGRGQREWFAPPGTSLLYSLLLRESAAHPLLPLLVPLAVSECAEELVAVECSVKWPNDVWIGDGKLAGVLIEGHAATAPRDRWAVVGVGINRDLSGADIPEELEGHIAWLGQEVEAGSLLAHLNAALARWLLASEALVLEEFRRRDLLSGRELHWEDGSGIARGIDDSGHLLVETADGGVVAIGAGEVTLGPGLRQERDV